MHCVSRPFAYFAGQLFSGMNIVSVIVTNRLFQRYWEVRCQTPTEPSYEVAYSVSYKTMTLESDDARASGTCCAWKLAAALLVLRLCIGTHFFSEGTKKLVYDKADQQWSLNPEFTAKTEIVFRNATGPFAGWYKKQLPGFYDWENTLATPRESKPLSSEDAFAQQDWQNDYVTRRTQAKKEKQPVPIEIPDFAPYKAWAENVVEGLRGKLKNYTDLSGISKEQAEIAAKHFIERHQQIADFLGGESESIAEYRHELWRLEQMEKFGSAKEVPFESERVAAKRSETGGIGNRLVNEVSGIERGFNNDLRGTLTEEQRADANFLSQVEASLTSPEQRRLHWLNVGVTCLIIGVGACLLLGLFTRLASLGGIVFLVSVMVTQMPWVAGARADFFYYQLVECAALLTLLVCSPWRLPGIDYLLSGLWNKSRRSKG